MVKFSQYMVEKLPVKLPQYTVGKFSVKFEQYIVEKFWVKPPYGIYSISYIVGKYPHIVYPHIVYPHIVYPHIVYPHIVYRRKISTVYGGKLAVKLPSISWENSM